MDAMNQSRKTRIAHLAGPTATIQNTPPLVTSNKARAKHGLPLLKDADGVALRHDALRPQRLAAPTKVAPGTTMDIEPPSKVERDNIIAYLLLLKAAPARR